MITDPQVEKQVVMYSESMKTIVENFQNILDEQDYEKYMRQLESVAECSQLNLLKKQKAKQTKKENDHPIIKSQLTLESLQMNLSNLNQVKITSGSVPFQGNQQEGTSKRQIYQFNRQEKQEFPNNQNIDIEQNRKFLGINNEQQMGLNNTFNQESYVNNQEPPVKTIFTINQQESKPPGFLNEDSYGETNNNFNNYNNVNNNNYNSSPYQDQNNDRNNNFNNNNNFVNNSKQNQNINYQNNRNNYSNNNNTNNWNNGNQNQGGYQINNNSYNNNGNNFNNRNNNTNNNYKNNNNNGGGKNYFNKNVNDNNNMENEESNNAGSGAATNLGGFTTAREQLDYNMQKQRDRNQGIVRNPTGKFVFEDENGANVVDLVNKSVFGKSIDVPSMNQQSNNNYNNNSSSNNNNNNYNSSYSSSGVSSNTNQTKSIGLQKKFSPPIKKEDAKPYQLQGPNGEVIDDERLQCLDPKLVEMIESEIVDRSPQVKYEDIAGLKNAKSTIHQVIVWPLLNPAIFNGLRAPPKGLLLFGPPGTGKTMIGRAIASESQSTFFSISASSLTSQWVGEGQQMVKTLFVIAKIRQPSVIFIDEIDSLLTARTENDIESSRRIQTEFLVQLQGTHTSNDDRILIIGATNRPQELDQAARRRFVQKLYIPLPDSAARLELLKTVAKNETNLGNLYQLSQQEMNQVVEKTKGYSGADMRNLCAEASMIPIRSCITSCSDITKVSSQNLRPTNFSDFIKAISLIKATVSKKDLHSYIQWNKDFGMFQFTEQQLDN